MKDRVFLDTNVLVYLYSEDEPGKQSIAVSIFDNVHCMTSTQVLNEFCSVCLRKLKMPSSQIQMSISEIAENCEICYIDRETIQKALSLHSEYGYTYYDCLVLSSALQNGCNCLYSEDMQHNQIINKNLQIINPFQ
jgi:predicted nucleic acid-binding protein